MYSGWGIRTLSNKEVHYNPFSYHDGSIWPHDNAMISMGFGACKRTDLAATVLASMFKVAQSQPDLRLPELFCGFPNTYAEKPLWYPVSCSPQAWAAGSALMMLQGTLGLSVDGDKHEVSVRAARLPEGVSRLEIKGLPVGDGRTDLKFHREDTGTVCDAKTGPGVSSSIEASQ
jgi:glycogen debranching enzyme